MSSYIVEQATAAVMDAMKANLSNAINSMGPYKVSLNDAEKMGARSMATGREGYARAVSQIASANISSLARELNPADLVSRLAYDSRLEELRQLLMSLSEIVTETQMANSVDTMQMVDAMVSNLQVSRRANAALDTAMGEIDEWNKRFGPGRANTAPPDTHAPGA